MATAENKAQTGDTVGDQLAQDRAKFEAEKQSMAETFEAETAKVVAEREAIDAEKAQLAKEREAFDAEVAEVARARSVEGQQVAAPVPESKRGALRKFALRLRGPGIASDAAPVQVEALSAAHAFNAIVKQKSLDSSKYTFTASVVD